MENVTEEKLAQLLKEAEMAHSDYEQKLGSRDEDWPSWYARYILRELNE